MRTGASGAESGSKPPFGVPDPAHPVTRHADAHLARIMTSRFAAAQPPTDVAVPTISGTPAVGGSTTAESAPTQTIVQSS